MTTKVQLPARQSDAPRQRHDSRYVSRERTCPACGSTPSNLIGQLGPLIWLRCQACGLDRSSVAKGE